MENSKPKPYLVPVAIVAAGLLIAAAIFFRGGTTNPTAAKKFELGSVPTLAAKAGVNRADFEKCWQAGTYAAKVEAQAAEGNMLGAQGTPFPLIVTSDNRVIALPGALPTPALAQVLDEILAGTASSSYFTTLPATLPPITEQDHRQGAIGSPITIIEYSDLQCPFCKRFHDTMNEIKDRYDDQVTWVYRHLPLLSLHPDAGKLAEATECVAELGGNDAFWKFTDLIFAAH